MGFLKPPKPKADPAAEAQRKAEEQRANNENARVKLDDEQEQAARLRGQRGRLSLLSSAGELGFPSKSGV